MTMIFAFTGGIGLFLIIIGILENFGFEQASSKHKLDDLLKSDPELKRKRKVTPMEMLTILLHQARASISPAEFLVVSLGIGALLGVLMFLVSQALLLSLVMFIVGGFSYYTFLLIRRDRLSRQYEEAQAQVIYTLYFSLKAHGLDHQGAVETVANSGPEIVQDDWKKVAAAIAGNEPNYAILNELITYRSSPSFTRIVEALLLFRGRKVHELAQVLEDLRGDISLDVEIARENATHIFGARRQLMLVAAMPIALSLIFMLMLPTFKDFYSGALGQMLMLGIWGFSGVVYVFGARQASKASMVRPYVVTFAQDRSDMSYKPPRPRSAQAGAQNSTNDKPVVPEGSSVLPAEQGG